MNPSPQATPVIPALSFRADMGGGVMRTFASVYGALNAAVFAAIASEDRGDPYPMSYEYLQQEAIKWATDHPGAPGEDATAEAALTAYQNYLDRKVWRLVNGGWKLVEI